MLLWRITRQEKKTENKRQEMHHLRRIMHHDKSQAYKPDRLNGNLQTSRQNVFAAPSFPGLLLPFEKYLKLLTCISTVSFFPVAQDIEDH